MKTAAQRAAKRSRRENREKAGTWWCGACNERHPNGERCPIPLREKIAAVGPSRGVDVVAAALAGFRHRNT